MAEVIKRTHEEWLATLRDRFGESPADWAFRCPSCGDVASGSDFREALAATPAQRKDGTSITASDRLGMECIGRTLGALKVTQAKWTGRGCDWVAYGLFRGPEFVVVPDGREIPCFPMAEAAEVAS